MRKSLFTALIIGLLILTANNSAFASKKAEEPVKVEHNEALTVEKTENSENILTKKEKKRLEKESKKAEKIRIQEQQKEEKELKKAEKQRLKEEKARRNEIIEKNTRDEVKQEETKEPETVKEPEKPVVKENVKEVSKEDIKEEKPKEEKVKEPVKEVLSEENTEKETEHVSKKEAKKAQAENKTAIKEDDTAEAEKNDPDKEIKEDNAAETKKDIKEINKEKPKEEIKEETKEDEVKEPVKEEPVVETRRAPELYRQNLTLEDIDKNAVSINEFLLFTEKQNEKFSVFYYKTTSKLNSLNKQIKDKTNLVQDIKKTDLSAKGQFAKLKKTDKELEFLLKERDDFYNKSLAKFNSILTKKQAIKWELLQQMGYRFLPEID